MNIFGIFTLVGGLALFLYGMEFMGDGLSRLSGGKMEQILEKLTSKRIMGVMLGLVVTAIIQSSSATTVMVVGFVNSGIMSLSQAVGVIMGANIGTTATSWLLSLTGIRGSNLFLNLLKPSSFSPVLAAIGIILYLSSKNGKKRDVGCILLGFAILMTGMETMSGGVAPLSENTQFTHALTMFSNPILGLLAGTLLTAIIQSSSASIGILQALALSGTVTFGTAIPIIMGQNIGTCVTALLSCIGTSKNAKRAAMIHLYFNLIGTMLFMIVFYTINTFVHFSFLGTTANVAQIAIIHSAFNIGATIVLFPFGNLLVKLATITIKDDNTEEETVRNLEMDTGRKDFKRLDERFLEQPGLAIAEAKAVTASMARQSMNAMVQAMSLLDHFDPQVAKKVAELEDLIDQYEENLGTYLVKLSGKELQKKDSQMLTIMLHCVSDFERISDHALNIQEGAAKLSQLNEEIPLAIKKEFYVYSDAIRDILNLAVVTFESESLKMARQIEPLEQVIDDLNDEVKQRQVQRLIQGECSVDVGFVLSDVSTNFERVADHCSNVGVSIIEISNDEFDTHEYVEQLTKGNNPEFEERYKRDTMRYKLPTFVVSEKASE